MKTFFGILGIVIGIVALTLLLMFLVSSGYIGIALGIGAVVYVFLIMCLVYPKHPGIAGVVSIVGVIIFLRLLVVSGQVISGVIAGVVAGVVAFIAYCSIFDIDTGGGGDDPCDCLGSGGCM